MAVVLRPGDSNDLVRLLQARLNRDYPLYSNLVVDGIYGPRTTAHSDEARFIPRVVLKKRPGAPSLDRVEVVQPVLSRFTLPWPKCGSPTALSSTPSSVSPGAKSPRPLSGRAEPRGRGAHRCADSAVRRRSGRPWWHRVDQHAAQRSPSGSHTVTVAGELNALKSLVTQLNQLGVAATVVPASIPSHCAAAVAAGLAFRAVNPTDK
jgi:hypothetical protein